MLYTSQELYAEDNYQVLLEALEQDILCLHKNSQIIRNAFPLNLREESFDPHELADRFFQEYLPAKVTHLYSAKEMILYRNYHGRFLTKDNGVYYISGEYEILTTRHVSYNKEYIVYFHKEPQLTPLVFVNSLLADENMAQELWALEEKEGRILTKTMKQAEVQRILKLHKRGLLKKDFGVEITHQSRDQIIESLL